MISEALHFPGVFIANVDGSLVLATFGAISSEFNDLGNAGWLISSYTLAMCATQSLVCHQDSGGWEGFTHRLLVWEAE